MTNIDEVQALLSQQPEYKKTLNMAVKHEELNSKNPNYLGWAWYDVETLGAKLQRLVINGIIKVNFKSRSATYYLLKDAAIVKRAIS